MFLDIFRKQPPPPPPPKKLSPWISIVAPIIFAIIVGLLSMVYTSIADELKQKVDNQTLQLMIEKQQQQIETQQQRSDDKFQVLLEQIKELKQEKIQTPKIEVEKEKNLEQNTNGDPPLTLDEFKEYLKLSKEERKAFRSLHPSYEKLPK